ncbi:hypothetical protein H0H81_012319, partial [Sphagnurus paluster]
ALDSEDAQHLCKKIVEFGPRLTDLSLQFASGGYDVVRPLLGSRNCSLTALRKLTFTDYSSAEEDLPLAITVFRNTPSLTEVYFHVRRWTLLRSGYWSMPWNQLTTLTICGRMTIYDFCSIFFQCTQLRAAHLTRIDVEYHRRLDADDWDEPHVTTFPQLTELTLQFCGSEEEDHPDISFRDAIDMLELPQIQALRLAGDPVHSQPFMEPVRPWVATLHVLCLWDVQVKSESLLDLLYKCASLEHLALSLRDADTAPLLRALCSNTGNKDPSRAKPLRRLTTLILGYYPCFYVRKEEEFERAYTELGCAFSDFIAIWIKDSLRAQPFVSATLLVCDFRGRAMDILVNDMFNLVRSRLDALAEEIDAARKCQLVTMTLTEYAELSRLLGLHNYEEGPSF